MEGPDRRKAKCAASGCKFYQNRSAKLHFFKFPKDKVRRQQWLKFCQNPELEKLNDNELDNRKICHHHFVKDHISLYPNRVTLSNFKEVVPTLHGPTLKQNRSSASNENPRLQKSIPVQMPSKNPKMERKNPQQKLSGPTLEKNKSFASNAKSTSAQVPAKQPVGSKTVLERQEQNQAFASNENPSLKKSIIVQIPAKKSIASKIVLEQQDMKIRTCRLPVFILKEKNESKSKFFLLIACLIAFSIITD